MTGLRDPEIFRVRVSSKRLPSAPVDLVRRLLQRLLGLDRFNSVYRSLGECSEEQFSQTFLEAIGARWLYKGEQDSTIPRAGPLVIVANHPYGLIDGLAVEALLLSYRKDFKLMLTHRLSCIPEFKNRHVFVDPETHRRRRSLSLRGWLQASRWLRSGGAIGIFPAGHMARFSWERMGIEEQKWSPHVFDIARSSGASVLPVHIHGSYAPSVYVAGALYPSAIDMFGVGAVERWRGRGFEATLGPLIAPQELSRFDSSEAGIAFLKQQVERLAGN